MTELPRGWIKATLDELCVKAQPGFASGKHNRDGNGVVHLRPMNITRNGEIDLSDTRYVTDSSERRVRQGDVLFNNTNSPELVGKTAFVANSEPLAYSNHMTRLQTPDGLSAKFLAIQLHFLWMQGYFRSVMNNHVNQASVSSKALLKTAIVVPPEHEQQQIVTAIEDHLSRLHEGISSVGRAATLLPAWESSLLLNSTVEHPMAKTWESLSVGAMAKVSTGATPSRSRSDYYDGGTVPWVTSSLLNQPFVDRADKFITEKALRETSVKLFPPGTLLMAMYGEGKTRGRCSELRITATTNQACAAIQVQPAYESRRPWIKLVLEATYESNRQLAVGGVQPNLNLGLIRNINIPLPPEKLQEEILGEVERQRSIAASLQASIAKFKTSSNLLRKRLLNIAFSGGLVPQALEDEPAAALLERIRADYAAELKSGRTRRRRATTLSQEELPL